MIILTIDRAINGSQLRREIAAVTGIILDENALVLYDDGTFYIRAPEGVADAIRAVIDAHVPQSRALIEDLARGRVNALAGIAAKDLTASQVRDMLLGIAVRTGVLDLQGQVLPYDDWGTV